MKKLKSTSRKESHLNATSTKRNPGRRSNVLLLRNKPSRSRTKPREKLLRKPKADLLKLTENLNAKKPF